MIASRIAKKPDVRDDFTYLGNYIAAAKEKGEKLDKLWIVNCDAGGTPADLETALIEVEAKRKLKPGVKNKTYHLVVSFRPGEREKLADADLKRIEREFASALGFANHQRIAGTHINTDNFHMHVAYSMVDPATLKMVYPKNDFKKLERTARKLEREFGLQVDRGMSDREKGTRGLSQSARKFEALTWQQSFESHLRENRDAIVAAVASAGSWQDLHDRLKEFDAGLKKHGAGMVFFHLQNPKTTAKASSVDRSCSLAAVEKRLGPFIPDAKAQERAPASPAGAARRMSQRDAKEPKKPYFAKPLFTHPGQDRLWRFYQSGSKVPGFFARNLHIRNWKTYLMADAHKDALALATIVFYKEMFRSWGNVSASQDGPKAIKPALGTWLRSASWDPPKPDLAALAAAPGTGFKIDDTGHVFIPRRDADGKVWAVRAMDPKGRVFDIGDASAAPPLAFRADPRGLLGDGKETYAGPVIISADPRSAGKLHKRTGAPLIVTDHEKDLPAFAKEARERHPKAVIIVIAPQRSKAAGLAAKLKGVRVMSPGNALAISPDLADQVKAFGPQDRERPPAPSGTARRISRGAGLDRG